MSDDYQEIANLYARYAELLNLGHIDEVAELFRYGRISSSMGTTVHEGSEQIGAMYRESVRFHDKLPDTLLFTSNLQLEIDGDTAHGKAYFMAMHQMAGAIVPVVAGRYQDQFRRIDGTWWFHERRMAVDLTGDLSTHLHAPLDESALEE